jgi:hypothetical protein
MSYNAKEAPFALKGSAFSILDKDTERHNIHSSSIQKLRYANSNRHC